MRLISVGGRKIARSGIRRPRGLMLETPTAVFALVLSVIAYLVVRVTVGRSMIDFAVYRLGGASVGSGHDLYGDLGAPQGLLFTYPPFAALTFTPYRLLSFTAAVPLVTIGNLVLLGVVAHQSCVLVRLPGARVMASAALLAAITVWSEPVWTTLGNGQINLAVLALVLADFTTLRSTRWCGLGIGLAAGLKVTPLVFIGYLVLTRRPRAALVAGATFAGTVAVSTVFSPQLTWRFWTRYLWDTSRVGDVSRPGNQSFTGALARVLDPGGAEGLTSILALGVVLVFLAAASWVHGRLGDSWGLPLCAVAGLLGSPITWTHHWVWCLPIVVLLVSVRSRLSFAAPVFWTFGALVVPRIVSTRWTTNLWSLATTDWYFVFGIAFAVAAVRRARGARADAPDVPTERPVATTGWTRFVPTVEAQPAGRPGFAVVPSADGLAVIAVGVRVTALHNLGALRRAPVPRGSAGVVVDRRVDDTMIVDFDNGHRLALDPHDITATEPEPPGDAP